MDPALILAVSLLTAVSNVTDRVTAERTERLEKGHAIADYEHHMASIEQHRAHSTGGGELSELADMEHAVPRLKGMAEIERQGRAETPELRRMAAFCDTFSPVLVLSDDETRRFVAHLAKQEVNLAKTDKALADRLDAADFQAEVGAALAKYGCGYTQYVFTYPSDKKLKKLSRAIEKRLTTIFEMENN